LDETASGLKAMLAETVGVRRRLGDASETPLALIFRIYETALCTSDRLLSIEQICASGHRIATCLSKGENIDSDSD
jgi:hypothetical protein